MTAHALSALALSLIITGIHPSQLSASPVDADPPERPAAASADAAAPAEAAAQDDDNAASFEPAEPDYRLINLPTTLRLPLWKGSFDLTHRFAGNLIREGTDFGDQLETIFGIDDGATVGFEYRVAVAPRVQAVAFRTAFGRTIQFYGKYDALHQHGSMPLSASVVVSVEGTNNFREDYSPAVGATISRQLGDKVALYAAPMWVHNTAASIDTDEDTFFFGVGGRVRIRDTVYVAAEVSPRLSGYQPGEPEFGFAIEKRAGGHMFQLNVTNSFGTTLAQTARGGQEHNLQLGFNLSRKFF